MLEPEMWGRLLVVAGCCWLQQRKKELEEQVKMNRLSELDELITTSGKSFEEVKELLKIGK